MSPTVNWNRRLSIPLLIPLDNPAIFASISGLMRELREGYPQIRRSRFQMRNPTPPPTVDAASYLHAAGVTLDFAARFAGTAQLVKWIVDYLKRIDRRVKLGRHDERTTMRKIRAAIRAGRLGEPFRAKDVNNAIGITYAGVFLPKHRLGNPGENGEPNSEHFEQIARGLYRLIEPS